MPKIAILFGFILIAIGLFGFYLPDFDKTDDPQQDAAAATANEPDEKANEADAEAAGNNSSKPSFTALIPAVFGAALALCAGIAIQTGKPKHPMHAAAGIALLGALMSSGRAIPSAIKVFSGDPAANTKATIFLLLMAAACWGFVFVAVQSFLNARKTKPADES